MKKKLIALKNCTPQMSLMAAPGTSNNDLAQLIYEHADTLKKQFNFKNKYDLRKKLLGLINHIILEHGVMQQTARLRESTTWLKAFAHHITQLKILAECSSPETRGLLLEEMSQQTKTPVTLLHKVESILDMLDEGDIQILLHCCNKIAQKKDTGGIEKRTPIHIAVPRIIKIYEEGVKPKKSGARQKATCFSNTYTSTGWDGTGYKFTTAINSLLKKIHIKLSLGTDKSIGYYLKKGKKPLK